MKWVVRFPGRTKKQTAALPKDIQRVVRILALEIAAQGPARPNWTNYGKLKGKRDCHHCHLRRGNPTYVAVWQVADKHERVVEFRYVGTHAKADYGRLC